MNSKRISRFFIVAVLTSAICFSFSSCEVLNKLKNSETSSDITEKDNYVKGTLTDKSFESEYLNLKFECPSDFVMATEEEIDKNVAFAGEKIFTDKEKKLLDYSKATTVYEMMVQTPTGLPNANIVVEKTLKNITIEQYLESVKKQLTALENMKVTINDKYSEVKIAGQTYTKMTADTEYNNVNMMQEYYIRKQSARVIGIIVTYSKDTAAQKETLMNAFQPYK